MKVLLSICLIFLSGCSVTGDESKWRDLGPEQVKCKKHEFKMCGRYGSLNICECRLA